MSVPEELEEKLTEALAAHEQERKEWSAAYNALGLRAGRALAVEQRRTELALHRAERAERAAKAFARWLSEDIEGNWAAERARDALYAHPGWLEPLP